MKTLTNNFIIMLNKNIENWIIKTIPKKWTIEDETYLKVLKWFWHNNEYIWLVMWRSTVSIWVKWKRLHKEDNTYNSKHVQDKIQSNNVFFELINPKSVIDCYAGKRFYKDKGIKYISNDLHEDWCDYKLDAFKFLSQFDWRAFDLVDIDPFWSWFDCIDVWLRIAKKWFIITLWELWHKRFKRIDFVKDRYWIIDNELWIERIIEYILKRWLIYKKILNPVIIKDWWNIWRVYFEVKQYKELSQWNMNK